MKTKRTSDTTLENVGSYIFCAVALGAILWSAAATVAPSAISLVERVRNILH